MKRKARVKVKSTRDAAHVAKAVFDIDKKTLARCAKAAYERFITEAGFEHDARIVAWDKLKEVHRLRWAAIARAVLKERESK